MKASGDVVKSECMRASTTAFPKLDLFFVGVRLRRLFGFLSIRKCENVHAVMCVE